jgi:catechol 2,3-dioxygenase-like lactoylglutathione lyase family enzyme
MPRRGYGFRRRAAAAVDGTMASNATRVATVIDHLDHLVLTTIDAPACIDFYTRVLGMRLETFAGERQALRFGNQKINIHRRGHEYEPRAHLPVPGALDQCFIADRPLDQVIERLRREGVAIIEGPVLRTSATHKLRSVYLRDPDLNLIEISELVTDDL